MAPLSRAGILSLTALTLHYCVLSITLHIARSTPGPKFHASSAVWLTELFKMILAGGLVLWSGELRPRAAERRRMREDGWEPLDGMDSNADQSGRGVYNSGEYDNHQQLNDNSNDEKHDQSPDHFGIGQHDKDEWLELNESIPSKLSIQPRARSR